MDINPVLFPQITNREGWSPIMSIADDDTGDLIDLTNYTFALEIRRLNINNGSAGSRGYGDSWDVGEYLTDGPIITASLGNGITVIDIGVIQVFLTSAQMRSLPGPATYSVAMTATSSDDPTNTRQIFLGRLPVLDGMVS